jgi:RNA polymerase sigma factor (sigma-70 family)
MNVKIHAKNFDFLRSHEKLIDRQTGKIARILPTFPDEVVDLSLSVQKLPRGSQFQAALILALPQRTIRVEKIEDNASSSIVRAFAELLRRVKRFKSQLSRESMWRKESTRKTEGEKHTFQAWELETAIAENLDKIENYLRREIYHQVVTSSIPPGLIEPHALVDEVFLEVRSQARVRPTSLSMEQWMFQIARLTFQDKLKELEDHRDEPHMEELAAKVGKWEDEDLNFYQPDESLLVEDLIQDMGGVNPEQLIEREEIESEIHRKIASLAADVRESFVLFALEGFTSDEVAMMTSRDPETILKQVEEARAVLRRELAS